MSSTGASRFIAGLFSALLAAWASDCPPLKLTPEQRVAQVRDLDRAAQTALAARQFPEAVQKMREAVCLAPDSSRVHYSLGMAQAAAGDFQSARASLREADRLQPGSSLPLAMQVRVNVSLQDEESLKDNLRGAARRFPNEADLHAGLARFLAENKLYELALAESLRAKRTRDANASALVELAGLENTAGAYGEAIRNAGRVESDAALPNTLRSAAAGISGLSFSAMGQQLEAVQHLQQAVRLDPAQENSYLALAGVFEKSEQFANAVQVLQQGRRALPQSEPLLLPLGIDLVRAERYQEGLALLRDVLQTAPDNDQAYLNIASACRNLADPEGELDALRALGLRKPDFPQIHLLIARALSNFHPVDYRQVLTELEQAEALTPTDADVYYLRGKVYVDIDRPPDAITAFRRSIELRPMEPSAYYQLGRLYRKLGQTALAQEQMDRVKSLGAEPAR